MFGQRFISSRAQVYSRQGKGLSQAEPRFIPGRAWVYAMQDIGFSQA
jgi:hypothetical protein